MKFRESGMPNEQMWDTFFDPIEILGQLGINKDTNNLMDIGCGYGTFLIPAAELIGGLAVGIDIEAEMVDFCKLKVQERNISNIELVCGDISDGRTLQDLEKYKGIIDYVSLFNILHCEQPLELLKKSCDFLKPEGLIGVIHWKFKETPRGPSMEIRPTPDNIAGWAEKAGFLLEKQIELPPYHFGLVFKKVT